MKKLFYILYFFLPMIALSQPAWYKSYPSDYMWKNVGSAGFTTHVAEYTSLAFNQAGQPYVAFKDCSPFFNGLTGKATVMKFDGTNWVYVGSPGFSVDTINSISLAFDTLDNPHVAFMNIGFFGLGKVTVMKFNGTSWINVGAPKFSNDGINVTLKFSPSNQPYVGFIDESLVISLTVMKFDGNNWVNVGNPEFELGGLNTFSLAFSPSGVPYVGFDDGSESGKASVMKYDGNNWVYIGSKGFSADIVSNPSIAFDLSGEPYLAYTDYAYTYKATVMRFDGTGWVDVGNAGFTLSWAGIPNIYFSPSGVPYIAFNDGYYYKASVMSFNNTSWEYVGTGGISASTVNYLSFTFSPSGQPYLAYQDNGNSNKATVMKYDSVYVGINNQKNIQELIYPNPTANDITIDLKNYNNYVKYIEIYDITGKVSLKTQSINNKIFLNVQDLAAGIYIINVKTESSNWIGKFCKN